MSAIIPPSKMVVTGVMPDDDTQAIVVANHQARIGFWCVVRITYALPLWHYTLHSMHSVGTRWRVAWVG